MDHIIDLILQYKYLILLPIATIEGPIITVIGGFLVTLGLLNPFLLYIVAVTGDGIGDLGCYLIGRFGTGWVYKHGNKIGITETKIKVVRHYFEKHQKKALFFSKVIHGIGFAGLIIAGSLKIPYRRFFLICSITTLGQSVIFLVLGIFFGHAYIQIGRYLNYYAAGAAVIAMCWTAYFFNKKFNEFVEKEAEK